MPKGWIVISRSLVYSIAHTNHHISFPFTYFSNKMKKKPVLYIKKKKKNKYKKYSKLIIFSLKIYFSPKNWTSLIILNIYDTTAFNGYINLRSLI